MRRLADGLRAIFISTEALMIIVGVVLGNLFPEVMMALGERVKQDSDLMRFLPGLPILLAAAAFKAGGVVRNPASAEQNAVLYQWSDYARILLRVYIGWFYAGIAVISSIFAWIMSPHLPSEILAQILGICILVLEQARFSSDFHGIRYKLLKILDKIRPSLIGVA